MCVVLRRNRLRSLLVGTVVCTNVLYTGVYSCLVSSLGADPFTVLLIHVAEN